MKTVETGFNNKRLAVNMLFSVLAFILNLFIGFFITPYITNKFGSEAYGYVKLANDFANYASLITIALNSMASRFIMLERERGNLEKANVYYSSVMFANIFCSVILMIPSVICTVLAEKLLEIPSGILLEVKITFAITFAGFILNLLFSIFGNCFYLSNRLDLNAMRTAESNIIRVVVILGAFALFTPKIWFVPLGAFVSALYLSMANKYYADKLTPDLKVDLAHFQLSRVLELISAGIWNSITKLSQIFSSGLDLLITNMTIGSVMMGYLSVAKTVPNLIVSFNATLANIFSPNLMKLYADDDIESLKKATKSAMKFMCIFVSIPNAILITMGKEFFELWVPNQPAKMINILSVLTVINSCVTGPAQPLYQIFTITNKIRQSSIVTVIYGFSSLCVTLLFLKFTDLGVYAVAGVSLVGSVIVALGYHIPFSAKYIGLPKSTFFPEIGMSVLSLSIISAVGAGMNLLLDLSSSWVMWFAGACCTGILGLGVNMFLLLNKDERRFLAGKVSKFVKRRRS